MADLPTTVDVTLPPMSRVAQGVESLEQFDQNKGGGYVIWLGHKGDTFPKWGYDPINRDRQLREFWHTEPFLASAFGSQIARYSSFPWVLEGPERTTAIYESILNGVENGEGWQNMMIKLVTDLFTQSNGAWLEIIRTSDNAGAPVVSMRHLDAARCRRTGYPNTPVIYWDLEGIPHLMQWYQVVEFTEMPSPNILHRGLQLSVLDRIINAAQLAKAIQQFKLERVSGIKHHKLHLIGGFNQTILDTTMAQKLAGARGAGNQYYADPVMLTALNPNAHITHEQIDLNELPPDFNEEVFMKWYIGNISLAWEDDYQSFFPLPGGNLGTAQQSQTMADKSRSKGPAVFMKLIERKFNYYGVLPKNITFSYGEADPSADLQKAQLLFRFGQSMKMMLDSKLLTPEIAQLMMRDAGFLKAEYLTMLGHIDPTPQPVTS